MPDKWVEVGPIYYVTGNALNKKDYLDQLLEQFPQIMKRHLEQFGQGKDYRIKLSMEIKQDD